MCGYLNNFMPMFIARRVSRLVSFRNYSGYS